MNTIHPLFPRKEKLKDLVKDRLGDDWESICPFNVTGPEFRRNFNEVFGLKIPNAPLDEALENMIQHLEALPQ